MDILEVIIQLLIANGLATAKDKDIFKDYHPEDIDNIFSVIETDTSGMNIYSSRNVRYLQFFFRNRRVTVAKEIAGRVFNFLYKACQDEAGNITPFITLNGVACPIAFENSPRKIGTDEQGRHLVTFDISLTVPNI